MHLWLDTTHIRTIQKAVRLGLLSGITTNPTLLAATQRSLEDILEDLLHYQEGPVAVQVAAEEPMEIVHQGQTLHALSNRLIIKIPATKNGLEAIHLLSRQGIPTMATAIYHPHQALMAALAGAHYAVPYVGRLEKAGGNPWEMLQATNQVFETYHLKTKLLAASLSNIEHVMRCTQIGLYGATVKEEVFEQLIASPSLTLTTVEEFSAEWKRIPTSLF